MRIIKIYNWIVSSFTSLRANHKQAVKWSIIQGANLSDIQAKQSAKFHYGVAWITHVMVSTQIMEMT